MNVGSETGDVEVWMESLEVLRCCGREFQKRVTTY